MIFCSRRLTIPSVLNVTILSFVRRQDEDDICLNFNIQERMYCIIFFSVIYNVGNH